MKKSGVFADIPEEFTLISQGCIFFLKEIFEGKDDVLNLNRKIFITIIAFLMLSIFPPVFQVYIGNDCRSAFVASGYIGLIFDFMWIFVPMLSYIFLKEIYVFFIVFAWVVLCLVFNIYYFIPKYSKIHIVFVVKRNKEDVVNFFRGLSILIKRASQGFNILFFLVFIGVLVFNVFPNLFHLRSEMKAPSLFEGAVESRKQAAIVCESISAVW